MKGRSKVPLTVSLVMSVYLAQSGGEAAAQAGEEQEGKKSALRSPASLQAGASRGDPDAMYWYAMLHIEGKIEDADYDLGIRMLKRAATKGHKDAQRMYTFMDNAFSGEGC